MEYLIVLLIVLLIAAVIARPAISLVTIHDYQRGLRFRNGHLIGLLAPGSHLSLHR